MNNLCINIIVLVIESPIHNLSNGNRLFIVTHILQFAEDGDHTVWGERIVGTVIAGALPNYSLVFIYHSSTYHSPDFISILRGCRSLHQGKEQHHRQ